LPAGIPTPKSKLPQARAVRPGYRPRHNIYSTDTIPQRTSITTTADNRRQPSQVATNRPEHYSGQRACAPFKGLATYNPQSGVAKGILPGCNLRSKCRCSCPAVHMTTRILLRPSSTHEPSDPPRRALTQHNTTLLVVSTPTSGRQIARHTPTTQASTASKDGQGTLTHLHMRTLNVRHSLLTASHRHTFHYARVPWPTSACPVT
jgi:hypothetical protein